MSQQYQEKKQQNSANAQSGNAPLLVLNPEELESLEAVELQALQGNAHVASGVVPESETINPTSNAPWSSNIFSMASDATQGIDWDTQTGSQYILDGEVRTESTHNPYALPDEKVLFDNGIGKVTWEHATDIDNYSGSTANLGREGFRESSRSVTTNDHIVQESNQLTNQIDGSINHDALGITGGSSAQIGYSDKVTVVSGEAVQTNNSEAPSTVEERNRRLDGGLMVVKDNEANQVSANINGGYNRSTMINNGESIATVDRGAESKNEVILIQDTSGNKAVVVANELAGTVGHSNQKIEGNQVLTDKVYTKGSAGQNTTFVSGERSTTLSAGLDVGGSQTTEEQVGSQNITETTGAKVSLEKSQNIDSGASSSGVSLSGTQSTSVVENVDTQSKVQNVKAHEGTVFVQKAKNAEGEKVLTVGAQHGYTASDLNVNKDEQGNVSTEKSEWKTKNKLSATDQLKLSAESRVSHETAVGETNADGTSRSDSIIDEVGVKAETGEDISLEEASATLQLSRTHADKTERFNELNEKVTESNSKKVSLSGTSAKDKDGKFTHGVGLSAKDQNIVETIHADGSSTRDKAINQASIDSKKSLSVSTQREHIENIKKEKLTDNTTLTTNKGKRVLKAGASTVIDENGKRKYIAEGSASYTTYEQMVKHTINPLAKKLEGLKLGDKDVDGEDRVRMLQRALKAAGASIDEDGEFGTATQSALEDFQRIHGLEPTGVVDIPTADLFPRIGLLQYGATMTAGWHVGKADASLKAEAQFNGDQIKVKGVAGAKVTMVGGNAKIEVPAVESNLGGEKIQAITTVGVSSSVLAEVNGTVELDIDKSDGVNVGVGGELKAFAGAKAGVEIGSELRWLRNSSSHYGEMIKQYAKTLPGTWDDMLVDKVPEEIWPQLATLLVGFGRSKIMFASAGVEGSAGIGAEFKVSTGVNDGMLEVGGKIGGTFGLGAGIKTKVGLNPVDGVRFVGVLGMKGMNWLSDAIPEAAAWFEQVVDEVQIQTDNYLENKKQNGGFSGFAAGVVDFFGDDLLNLW